jgi:hypothetical protein
LIAEELMAGIWPGGLEHDEALAEAIDTTATFSSGCEVLSKLFPTETDERIVATTMVVRRSEVVSRDTKAALICCAMGDHDELRATVEFCIVACEEVNDELAQYLPQTYPLDRRHEAGDVSYQTRCLLRTTRNVSVDCSAALKKLLKVWFGAEVLE